jgi:SAM-dependent methyltransferase
MTHATQGAGLAVADERLEGIRCLSCTGATASRGDEVVCEACGAAFARTPEGVVEAGAANASFGHGLDRQIDVLVSALEALEPPSCTEAVIAGYVQAGGIDAGNPFWEGRADVARLVNGADGVVVDIGAGFGTIATALARSATHVFALDKSAGRARATAARARAEGLTNVTAVHADGTDLPLGSGTCDLAVMVGVLEWTGLGTDDPIAAQRRVLAEVNRVLKPDGTLLIGIENRFGAHYFLGMPEEHTGLRFSSLLPRRIATAYSRLARGVPMTTLTHSRRTLTTLVRDTGLEPRLGIALPTYSEPQLSFDDQDFEAAWKFYFRHIYRYASPRRRLAGAAARALPSRICRLVAPTFWLIGQKGGRPGEVPMIVAGRGDCEGDIKVVDPGAEALLRYSRQTGTLDDESRFLDGWSARGWICSPLLRRTRVRREQLVLAQATALLARRERRTVTDEVRQRSLEEAAAAVRELGDDLTPATRAWCEERLATLTVAPLDMVEEHGDFVTVNLVVEAPSLRLCQIDEGPASFALPGRDAAVLATDLVGLRRGLKHRDLDVALTELLRIPPTAREIRRLLWADFGADVSLEIAVALVVAAMLRYTTGNGRLPGLESFLERAADGALERALLGLERG